MLNVILFWWGQNTYHLVNYLLSDDNECESGGHDCDENALCINTEGSYKCDCNEGYNGNGFRCNGKILNGGLVKHLWAAVAEWVKA